MFEQWRNMGKNPALMGRKANRCGGPKRAPFGELSNFTNKVVATGKLTVSESTQHPARRGKRCSIYVDTLECDTGAISNAELMALRRATTRAATLESLRVSFG